MFVLAHPHVFLSVRPDERITRDVNLERVQSRSGRSLEVHPNSSDGRISHVGELVRRDEDSVQLVVSDKDVPARFAVLFERKRLVSISEDEQSAEREEGSSP